MAIGFYKENNPSDKSKEMSSLSLVTAATLVFIVAALLYYQSYSDEAFVGSGTSSTWTPAKKPIAGRQYNPAATDRYRIPADLSRAPVSAPEGSLPRSTQRPTGIPGVGTATGSREALAQLKDLRELDSKITTWLDAASTKDREQPGSLTPKQKQDMVRYQGRLAQIREELGTGMITDTYKKVAAETLALRNENAKWQKVSPSLTAIHSFGTGANPDVFVSQADYTKFFALFTAAILELQGQTQSDPLQKVRLQQLQVMRQQLNDLMKKGGVPPIKMGAAKKYLVQMLKTDQPLPTLISIEGPPQRPQDLLKNQFGDILREIKDMQFTLTVSYDPATAQLKRSLAGLMDSMAKGQVSPTDARSHLATLRQTRGIPSVGRVMPTTYPKGLPKPPTQRPNMSALMQNPGYRPPSLQLQKKPPTKLMQQANLLCSRIKKAFPEDAAALGCQPVTDNFQAETVINTVCNRLRYSVPSVTPEQFGCPARNV
jgi:hypothetical protein